VNDRVPRRGLDSPNIATGAEIFWNLTTAPLVEHELLRGEVLLAKDGPLVVRTGKHTGRSAKDKFTVKDELTQDVIWWNDGNKPMDPDAFKRLHDDFLLALADKEQLYVADLYGGSQPEHRVRVRVVNELAWHNLFIRTMLVRPETQELAGFEPEFTIIDLPSFRADPERHGSRSETVVAVNFSK
jgi:phosphoenolpyruvate carboxykinase (ATP)